MEQKCHIAHLYYYEMNFFKIRSTYMRKFNKGFTLIELLVVIAIIALFDVDTYAGN